MRHLHRRGSAKAELALFLQARHQHVCGSCARCWSSKRSRVRPVAGLAHLRLEPDGVAALRHLEAAVVVPRRRVGFPGLRDRQVARVGRGHLQVRLRHHVGEGHDVLLLVARRVHVGDVVGHRRLAHGEPGALARREGREGAIGSMLASLVDRACPRLVRRTKPRRQGRRALRRRRFSGNITESATPVQSLTGFPWVGADRLPSPNGDTETCPGRRSAYPARDTRAVRRHRALPPCRYPDAGPSRREGPMCRSPTLRDQVFVRAVPNGGAAGRSIGAPLSRSGRKRQTWFGKPKSFSRRKDLFAPRRRVRAGAGARGEPARATERKNTFREDCAEPKGGTFVDFTVVG